jgi:hypothetical protein
MELIVTAIVAALGKLGEFAVKDGYEKFKEVIVRKFGKESDLAQSVEKLEKKPESLPRQELLKEELDSARADEDEDIINAAKILIERIQAQPGGQQILQRVEQHIRGIGNITSGTGDITVISGPQKE